MTRIEAANKIRQAEADFLDGKITANEFAAIKKEVLDAIGYVEIYDHGARGIIPASLLYDTKFEAK